MKNNIITKELNGLEFNELRDYMKRMLDESIFAYNDKDKSFFKDCTMYEYFVEWERIWDEDENTNIGEGINTIAHQFVLNDKTRADFENAFEQARNAAYKEAIEDAIDEIEEETSDIEIEVIR